MQTLARSLATSLLLLPLFPCFAQITSPTELAKSYLATMPEGSELSIGIIDQGKIQRLGFRLENSQVQAVDNAGAIFEIGSITKTFTASLIMQQVAKGKLALDDPMQNYLPVTLAKGTHEGQSITVRHLLMHTSGLSATPSSFTVPYLKALVFAPKNPNRFFKARQYFRYLKKFELDYTPGQKWAYNNAGFGLLGTFVAQLNQSSWEQAVRANLFGPLGMTDSYFAIGKKEKKRLVPGITAGGKRAKVWEMDFIDPAGAIKSTLNDMLKYAAAQLQAPSGELAFLEAAHDPQGYAVKIPEGTLWEGNAMGLGWWHHLADDGNRFVWHGGGTGGYSAFVGFSLELDRAVVVLCNVSGSHPANRLENRIPKPMALGQALMARN